MPLVKLYFTPALLLLVLTCPQVSRSLPVTSRGPLKESCVSYANTLLRNITDTLTQMEEHVFNCLQLNVELNMTTSTPSACAPKESKCSGTVKAEFDQESCVTNIGEDLHHYYEFLSAQTDYSSLVSTVLLRLRELMENCFPWSLQIDVSKGAASRDENSFDRRLRLCKVLRGFQVRCITMNRAIGYMNSGEHTK
uniref:Zmp:0000001127 n=1 Tax=Gasterosteus aculeatus aculeatus TaxID=481459 RepID=G3PKZ2_GASAC|nr:interleukin-12 subunit alpha [Gasterosteus aculeatus aculeatus]